MHPSSFHPFLFVLVTTFAAGHKTLEDLVGNWTDVTSEVIKGRPLPEKLKPFFNQTAVEEIRRKNSTATATDEDWIIRDEDVNGEEEIQEAVNTATYDGKKTTITVSSDAGLQLYQHWLDQAVSGLMAAVATKKLQVVEKKDVRAHGKCAKQAKTVAAHAKCVAELLDTPPGKNEEPILKTSPLLKKVEKSKEIVRAPVPNLKKPKRKMKSHKKLPKSMERAGRKPGYLKSFKNSSSKSKSIEKPGRLQYSRRTFKSSSSNGPTSLERRKTWARKIENNRISLKTPEKYLKRVTYSRKPKRIDFSKSASWEKKKENWTGGFRHKREIGQNGYKPVNKKYYKMTSVGQASPFSQMAKRLTEAVKTFKKTDRNDKGWKDTLTEISEEGNKLKKKEKVKKMFKKRLELFTHFMSDAGVDPEKGLDALDLGMYKDDANSEKEDAKKEAAEMEKKMTPEQKIMSQPIKLIRQGVKLGLGLLGQNVSDFDEKTLKMISPKLMSLVPDEEDNKNNTVNLLSPSLFSLHNESGPHEHLSLSNMMSSFGKGSEDEWMNFVFEASGVSDAVTYMKQLNEKEEMEEYSKQKGPDGQPLYFTRENLTQEYGEYEGIKADHIQKLHSMFSQEQHGRLNETGYAALTENQLDFLYGPESPYNNSEALTTFRNVTEEDSKTAIEHTIRALAKEEMSFKASKKKDIVLSPIILSALINAPETASQPIILSPVLMTPLIQSPAIFGCVILSPWAFVPVILAPRILGPVVLSPIAFAPVILSPLALNPIILSPGIFLPIILSPLVLSPFILSPVAFAPIILSPFALSPFVLVPNLMSPLILSPFVLSPLILSPPAVSAFILNPYALSPVIKSDGFAFTAVLSPSWLS